MEKYNFVYMDSQGVWNSCTNPVFIAQHKRCRAVKKTLDLKEILERLNEASLRFADDVFVDKVITEYEDEVYQKVTGIQE